MPSSTDRLQAKFMNYDETKGPLTDGIPEATKVIKDAGGTISRGMIDYQGTTNTEDLRDAINFLCGEWDYGYVGADLWLKST